ncbi:MAG: hypothetical protein DMD69_14990 [Gemmatimonadetes bacterium]|nr:MAG: hypothetical protein DMD69_14990 [Gemmatimonadota bacterium]
MMPSPTPPSPASADRRTASSTPVNDISQLLPVDAATKASVRILVIDDERTLRESCASALQVEGYRVQTCGRGDEAVETLKRHTFDIVLVDLYMGHVPGMQLLAAALAANAEAIVIVITGKPSVESALEALRAGAWDYLPKPFTGTQLQVLIGRAAHTVQVARETRAQQERTGVDAGGLSVLGNAPVFRDAITLARRVATTDASVFITGESGSGTKLLRVIQDGVVRRVGSEGTDAVVNVRFIAATNRDPEEALRSGMLREDLYYRLRVVPIPVPALRERPDDVPVLAAHFLDHYWRRHRGADEPLPTLSNAAIWALRAHSWPGNVRELQNVMEHAVVLLEPGADVGPEDIPFVSDQKVDVELAAEAEDVNADDGYYAARGRLLAKFDRRYLTRVVLRAGGNLSKAARMARVDRTTFYRLMERHGLQRNLLNGPDE